MKSCETIGQYIESITEADVIAKAGVKNTHTDAIAKIREMRSLAKRCVPKGKEVIRYGMPTIQLEGKNLVHFAAMKSHFGFYPASSGVATFAAELTKLGIDFSKGCIRFPYGKPLPTALIAKIVKFRVREESM